jgi:hypothetical protein
MARARRRLYLINDALKAKINIGVSNMKSVCANCDLGLKRSECTDKEYIECECRKWIVEEINQTTLLGFMHLLDEALEVVYENKNDLRNNKARMIEFLSKSIIE